MNDDDKEQIANLTASFMTATAALTLKWAGNSLLALVTLAVVAEFVTGVDLISTAFALSPSALWIGAWAVQKGSRRIAAQAAAARRRS